MRGFRVVASLLIVALVLAPAVGFAGTDLSASPTGKHGSARLHHQPDRGWRSVPSTPVLSTAPLEVPVVQRLSAVETIVVVAAVARVPFIPPRG